MTVSSETYKSGPYGGNGSATVFAYQFRILDETHLKVIRTDPSGLETPLSLGVHYTVSGVGDAGGGNVVVVPAPVAGEKITILRNPPFTQETDLENQGAYLAQTVEDRFDLMTMQVQTVKERADRSVSLPASADTAGLDALIEDIVRLKHSVDEIDTVAAIAPAVSTTAASVATIGTVAANAGSVNTAAAHIGPIGTVSGSIASVNAAAANMAAIVAAPAQASNAAASATLAQRWANEAEDAQVSAGLYSAFHWAKKAMAVLVGNIGAAIHGAAAKVAPVGADEIVVANSADGWSGWRVSLDNLKAWLFSGPANITQSTAGTILTLQTSDAGSAPAPRLDLYASAVPGGTGYLLGQVMYSGKNSAGTKMSYGQVDTVQLANAVGAEAGRLNISTRVAGALAYRGYFGNGFYMAGATGGDPGAGKINAVEVQVNGVRLGGAPDAVLEDQKASGTAGGTFTQGAWQTRVLNTKVRDPSGLILLSSNQFTPTVDGWVEWRAPANQCGGHQTRLYNVTDAVTVGRGTSEATLSASATAQNNSMGGVAIVAGKTYRLEHQCTSTRNTDGLGQANGFGEMLVFARIAFWRTA